MNIRSSRTTRSRRIRTLVLGGMTAALFSLPVSRAGVVLQFEHESPGDAAPASSSAWIDADRLRMDLSGSTLIFRGDKQVLWVVDAKKGSYTELTKETMEQTGKQLSEAMAQMQEQMKDLPPDQRAMMEQMMGKLPGAAGGGGAKLEPVRTFVKNGKNAAINGFACTGYDGLRDGKKYQELSLTDWKNLPVKREDIKVFESLAEFFKALTGPFAAMTDNLSSGFMQKYGEGPNAIPGFPIRTVTEGMKGQVTEEVKKIERLGIDPSRFELPAGLKKQSLELPKGKPEGND